MVIVLLINYTPWGNSILGTASFEPAIWGLIILFAAGLLILEELRKRIVGLRRGRTR
jgi:hypothetical protein